MISFLPSWLTIPNLVFGLLLLFLFGVILSDFKVTSRQSWMLLLGLGLLGGWFVFRTLRVQALLKELEEREKKLKELEKKYNRLYANHEITEQAYQEALSALAKAKRKLAESITSADTELQKKLQRINKDTKNPTVDDTLKDLNEVIRSGNQQREKSN